MRTTWRNARRVALPCVVILSLGGCASGPDVEAGKEIGARYLPKSSAGRNLIIKGDFAAGRAILSEAIDELQVGSEPYYDFRLYRFHADTLAEYGASYLLEGQPELAAATLEKAYTTLQDGERKHIELQAKRDEAHNNAMLALNIVSAVATGVARGQAISQGYSPTVVPQIPMLPMNRDTTDEVSRYLGDRPLEGDGIRMWMPRVLGFHSIAQFETGVGRCTASVIGFRIALTNAHCVTDDAGRHLSMADMRVAFDSFWKRWEIPVVEVHTHQQGRWDNRPENDWALLVLEYHPEYIYPLPVVDTDALQDPASETRLYSDTMLGDLDEGYLALSGHSGDLNDGRFQTLDWGCSFVGDSEKDPDSDLLLYDCVSAPGSSGSPVLFFDGDRSLISPKVIGVHWGGWQRSDGFLASGVKVRRFLPKLAELRGRISGDPVGAGDVFKAHMAAHSEEMHPEDIHDY